MFVQKAAPFGEGGVALCLESQQTGWRRGSPPDGGNNLLYFGNNFLFHLSSPTSVPLEQECDQR